MTDETLAPDEEETPALETPDAPEVITLPPFLVLFALVGGIVMNWAIPLSFGTTSSFLGGIGLLMLLACFGGMAWSLKLFQAADTNVSPRDPSTAIVTDGPYQYSRNPMYMCMLLGFAGLSFMDDAPMMLALIIPLFFVLDLKVIIPEEAYLTDKFGETYTVYQSNVRRWL